MREWRSKWSQLAGSQDNNLVDQIHNMEVMQQQLQEYGNIISTQQSTIEEMMPPIIATNG